jgi:hypothetical protein
MTTDRSQYIAGLRELADLLEQHEELELPYSGYRSAMSVIPADNQLEQVAAWARALPGRVEKRVRSGYFDIDGNLAGLKITVIADRDKVCERVVVGTETVTRTVPDPDVEVPLVEVTEQVERVEWRCLPLLAGEQATS